MQVPGTTKISTPSLVFGESRSFKGRSFFSPVCGRKWDPTHRQTVRGKIEKMKQDYWKINDLRAEQQMKNYQEFDELSQETKGELHQIDTSKSVESVSAWCEDCQHLWPKMKNSKLKCSSNITNWWRKWWKKIRPPNLTPIELHSWGPSQSRSRSRGHSATSPCWLSHQETPLLPNAESSLQSRRSESGWSETHHLSCAQHKLSSSFERRHNEF